MESDRNALPSVIQLWKEFNLDGRRSQMDETGLKIAKAHDESLVRRRELAETTQRIRRDSGIKIAASVGDLVKQYQQEIDRLTHRASYGEKAFLEIYHALCEAPDPVTVMERAKETTSKVSDLESRVLKQAQELAEYSAESEEIRNQHATIRRLDEKIRSLEQQLQTKDDSRDIALQEAREKLDEEIKLKEIDWEKRVTEAKGKLDAMARLHQESQDQLLLMQTKNEEIKARHVAELDLATTELERSHNRVLELERELQATHISENQHQNATASPNDASIEQINQLQSLLDERNRMLKSLKEQLTAAEKQQNEAQSAAAMKVTELETELKEKEKAMTLIKEELNQRPTLEEINTLKQQLKIYQAVQYNSTDGIEDETTVKAESIDSLLIKKNKHLEHQLTAEKLKEVELQKQLEQYQEQLKEVERQLQHHKNLVLRLEEDLLAVQNSKSAESLPKASDLEETVPDESKTSMATILRDQRDRLRKRTLELETRLNEAEKRCRSIQTESEAIRADNVSLVERLRYLQGYKKDHASKLDVESGLAAEEKYTKDYESRMNPFQEFQGRQRERRRRELNLVDRTVLIFGDLIFGYKYARVFLCLYIMLLHVLVMSMLAIVSERHRDSQLLAHGVEQLCRENGFTPPL